MTRRSDLSGPPRVHVDGWPDGVAAGPEAAAVAVFARRLAVAVEGRSLRQVAAAAGLRHPTVAALLRGESWPDVVSVVRLEDALEADLWPSRTDRRLS